MQKPSITVHAAVFICIAAICCSVNAEHPAETAAAMPETLSYLHLYTDADGMTHFRDERFEFHSVRLKQGVVEDWHNAPRTQFAIVVQGEVELTAGDGEVRRLTTGMVALLDDTKGKGHKTAALGAEDHIALMIPVKSSD